MSAAEILRRITAALDQADIEYMLTGSFASAYHGVPRSTQDIDFVINATEEKLKTLVQALPETQYYVDLTGALEAHRRQSIFNLIDLESGWKIDFIICKSRAFSEEEFRRRRRAMLHGANIFVASAEDVIVSKLEWAKLARSQRQIEDAAAILRVRVGELDREYLEKWIHGLELSKQWDDAQHSAEIKS